MPNVGVHFLFIVNWCSASTGQREDKCARHQSPDSLVSSFTACWFEIQGTENSCVEASWNAKPTHSLKIPKISKEYDNTWSNTQKFLLTKQ